MPETARIVHITRAILTELTLRNPCPIFLKSRDHGKEKHQRRIDQNVPCVHQRHASQTQSECGCDKNPALPIQVMPLQINEH